MAKTKTRNILYLARIANASPYWISGLTFREFVQALPEYPNLLLLRHAFTEASPAPHLGMDVVPSNNIPELMQQNIYDWGDFWWVDVSALRLLQKLPKHKIAELAYLSRLGETYGSPWFGPLQNKFVYLGHDDGWCLKLYARPKVFQPLFARIIELKALRRWHVHASMAPHVTKHLVRLLPQGIAIDLRHRKNRQITIHRVGPTTDIDGLQNRGWGISQSNIIATLRLENQTWTSD